MTQEETSAPTVQTRRRSKATAMGLLFLGLFFLGIQELSDPDIWWHLAQGHFILDHGRAPPDAFFGLHQCLDPQPLVTSLPDAIFAAVHGLGGVAGLFFLRLFVFLGLFGLLYFWCTRTLEEGLAAGVVLLIALVVHFRLSVRPELLSFVFFAAIALLFSNLVERTQKNGLPLAHWAGLFVLQALWAYSHSAFPLGFLSAGLVALVALIFQRHKRVIRDAGVGLLALALGITVQPEGWAGFIHPFVMRPIAQGLREWTSPLVYVGRGEIDIPIGALLLLGLLWIAAPFFLRGQKDVPIWHRWALGLPMLVLAFDGIRHMPFFAFTAALWLPPALSLALPRLEARAAFFLKVGGAIALAGAVLGASSLFAIVSGREHPLRVPSRTNPLAASAYLKEAGAEGLVFTRLHHGNWLLLNNPEVDVVWTGRQTYSHACQERLRAARAGDLAAFDAEQKRIGFDLVLLELGKEEGLRQALLQKGWRPLHLDLRTLLLASPRSERHASLATLAPENATFQAMLDAESSKPDPITAALGLGRTGYVLAQLGHAQAALDHLGAAARMAPGHADVLSNLARYLVFLKMDKEATAVLEDLRALDPDHPSLGEIQGLP
jgi:hypothetical protein